MNRPVIFCSLLALLFPLSVTAMQSEEVSEPVSDQQLMNEFGGGVKAAVSLGVIDGDQARAVYMQIDSSLGEEEESSEDSEAKAMMEDAGMALREAVVNGSMTKEEARDAWQGLMEEIKVATEEWESTGKDRGDSWASSLARSGRLPAFQLRIYQPGQVYVLLRPEFLERDASLLRKELALDRDLMPIIDSLLIDYVDSVRADEERFKTLFKEVRSRSRVERIDTAMAGLQNIQVDWERANISDEQMSGEKGEWIAKAISTFDDRLANIQRRLVQRRSMLIGEGPIPTFEDLRRLASEIEANRSVRKNALIQGIKALLTAEQLVQLSEVLEFLSLEQGRIDARLGGAAVDVVAAYEDVAGEDLNEEMYESIVAELEVIEELTNSWTQQRIRRERKGLEVEGAEARGEDAQDVLKSYAGMLMTELNTEVAIRDGIQSMVNRVQSELEEADPVAAERFRDVTQREGFSAQQRIRWAERVLDAAIMLEAIDTEVLTEVLNIQSNTQTELAQARIAAIRQRQAAEPRVARNQIQMMTGDADLVSMRAELIQEPGFKEFNRLDDQVERQLLALLGPELMKELPRRPGSLNKDGKGKNEGKGKGEGKGNAKGGGKAGGKGGQGGRAGGGKGRGGGGYSK